MAFNSHYYFLFLLVVFLIHYFTIDRWRWLVLLTASYCFYAALNAPYLLAVLFMVTCISYVCGLRIAAQKDEVIRKRWLWVAIFASVAILVLFKYLPFLESQVNSIFGLKSAISQTLISIGVSYYTFQSISYLTDIYLEIEEPEKHFGYYALYLAFFPKLLQGPIERAGDLLPQLNKPYQFNYDVIRSGMLLFTWGLFKKVVVADRLAPYANQVFNNVNDYTGLSLIIGIYAYALQIYFDFSAYTDMARGAGRIFGINLAENFNRPYLAISIADFWRRWHISFSRWILDYIFKPLQLGWRNLGSAGTALALIITFLVSGVWHGASWGFVIWGLLHGIYLAVSTYYRPYQIKIHKLLGVEKSKFLRWWQVCITFNLVSFAWIFFRSEDIGSALIIIKKIFFHDGHFADISRLMQINSKVSVLLALVGAGSVIIYDIFRKQKEIDDLIFALPTSLRWSIYYLLALAILLIGNWGHSQFLYFRF